MRSLLLLASIALLAAGPGAAAATRADSKAALRLTSTSPVTLRGSAFKPGERVTLTVRETAASGRRVRKVTAGRLGGFVARFPALLGADRCEVVATAVGNRGSRATLKTPQALCRPREAALLVTDLQPVTVVGSAFLPGENVVVEATLNGELAVRHARATTGGRFTVAFSGLAVVDRCSSDLLVRAIGARGSEAAAKIGPLPQCAPRN